MWAAQHDGGARAFCSQHEIDRSEEAFYGLATRSIKAYALLFTAYPGQAAFNASGSAAAS